MIRKKVVFAAVLFIGGLLWSFSFSYVYAYSPEKTHYPLSLSSAELYNRFYPEQALDEEEKQWIAQGAADEENPSARVAHHFYDPINNEWPNGPAMSSSALSSLPKGFPNGFESSKQWARDDGMQGLNRFQYGLPRSVPGIFTWDEAVKAYQNGRKEQAYKSLGHILHLIQDAAAPANVRQSSHSQLFEDEFGGKDPYEYAVENMAIPSIEGMNPAQRSDLNAYFDFVAAYTNTHFLSKDSVGMYEKPSPTRIDSRYVYGKDESGKEYRLARIYQSLKYFADAGRVYYFSDPLVVQDYWSRLAPVAIENGAGIIKLFHDTVEKIPEPPQEERVQEKNDLLGKIGGVFGKVSGAAQGAVKRAGQEFRRAGELVSFVSSNIMPGLSMIKIEVGVSLKPAISPPFIGPFRGFEKVSVSRQTEIWAERAQKQFDGQLAPAVSQFQDDIDKYARKKRAALLVQERERIAIRQNPPAEKLAEIPAQLPEEEKPEKEEKQTRKQFLILRVIDGDTVILEDGQAVRYIGIDSPEVASTLSDKPADCYANEAKQRNMVLVEGKLVEIESGPEETDIYGRMLGYIWLGDILINENLVREGYARANNFGHPHPYDDKFDAAQSLAKEEGAGLWGDACAVKEEEKEKETERKEAVPFQLNTALLINEVKAQNGEFVELYNPSSSATSLGGYYFVYYPQGRTQWNDPYRNKPFPSDASISAGGYYLIGLGEYTGNANWQPYTSNQLGNSAGTVALWAGDPAGQATAIKPVLIDAVGWGSVTLAEGLPVLPSPPWDSIARVAGKDTHNNSADFSPVLSATPNADNLVGQSSGGASPNNSSGGGGSGGGGGGSSSITPASIIINEIQVNDAEFVELYNTGSTAANLAGHYFSYYSSTKTAWNDPYRNKPFPSDSIAVGGYYLIGLKDYPTTGGNPNSDWQPYTSAQLSNDSGAVAVFPFDPAAKTAQEAGAGIIDAIGWGQVSLFEAAAAVVPAANQSIARNQTHSDTNNNSQDFQISSTPTPKQNAAQQQDTISPSQVSDLHAVSGASRGTIQLSWASPGDDGNQGMPASYIIKYAAQAITSENWDSAQEYTQTIIPKAAGQQESLTIENLTPGQTYYFALKSQDEVPNISAISNSPSSLASAAPTHAVINEIQTGKAEFVEFYNPGSQPLSLNGYYFAYYSSSKTAWNNPHRSKPFLSDASIPAGGYYLIGLKDYPTIGGNPNSDWQAYESAQLSSTEGTVAIFSQDPELGTEQSPIIPIDAVAWGGVSSALKEGTPAQAPSSDKSVSRNAEHWDSENNAVDFSESVLSTPTNSSGET